MDLPYPTLRVPALERAGVARAGRPRGAGSETRRLGGTRGSAPGVLRGLL